MMKTTPLLLTLGEKNLEGRKEWVLLCIKTGNRGISGPIFKGSFVVVLNIINIYSKKKLEMWYKENKKHP